MYWYTRKNALKINSGELLADAWHHRTDALSSIGALMGIFGAGMGIAVLNPIASNAYKLREINILNSCQWGRRN